MKNLEQRVAKLEDAVERRLDRSGSLAAQQAQRERLIDLSKIPEARGLARESAELMLAGAAPGSLVFLDLQRRLDGLWRNYYGEGDDSQQPAKSA